jgi:putative protease
MNAPHSAYTVKPEIMSPAGYWPQLHAAVEAGADAVYFGLKHFSARAKVGFDLDELPSVLQTLHRRGVRGYVTFNTLIFEHELAQAARTIAAIADAGADAIIVQDLGIAGLARQIAPDLELHGSTQMSITSAEGIALAQRYGVTRVVLARELALPEVAAIRAATDCELEIFVHGALCVSYSGQCFSSEAWGGRSANRGQCAQACRLPYDLIVDGRHQPLGAARYLLSPGDLATLDYVPRIVELGISALKIEGRYKDAEYVALTTSAYRRAVDAASAGLPAPFTHSDELRLGQVYSRGLGSYFISGTNHQSVVQARAPRHRGLLMGRVDQVGSDRVWIVSEPAVSELPLKPGDGVVFDAADRRSPEEPEEGGRLYHVTARSDGRLEIEFANDAVDFRRIRPGDLLWRTHDPETDRAARPFIDPPAPVQRRDLAVQVVAHEGAPLELTWCLVDRPEVFVTVRSPEPLGSARRHGVDGAYLREQLGRLGTTAYRLARLDLDRQGAPFAPSSLLNRLRREAITRLDALQAHAVRHEVRDPLAALEALLVQPSAPPPQSSLAHAGKPGPSGGGEAEAAAAQLHLLVRTPEQLAAAIEQNPASITLDYLELYGLRPAVERVRAAGILPRVASPRVLKPNEQRIVHFLLKLDCPILVRSGGLLEALQPAEHQPLIGDFSLNAANQLTATRLLGLGLERITPTHDLNAAQVVGLARSIGPDHLEVVAYQHLPVFHTEHCVFCRFLSEGTSYKDCGHPCETQRIALRDRQGRAHPVLADVGCRNTVFGAEAQQAARHLAGWRAGGIRHYRLEFVHENATEVAAVTDAFRAALAGDLAPAALEAQLRQAVPQGVTEGSLFVPGNFETIPLMQ